MTTREEPSLRTPGSGTQAASFTAEPRVLLRIRVSRDAGRTWGRVTEVREDENLPPLENPGFFLPCTCRRCSPGVPSPSTPAPGWS